jgi:hypothetical protein
MLLLTTDEPAHRLRAADSQTEYPGRQFAAWKETKVDQHRHMLLAAFTHCMGLT